MTDYISTKEQYVSVFYQKGDMPFITACNGQFQAGCYALIENDMKDNIDEYFHDGDGLYLYKASLNQGDRSVGIGEHYELDQLGYTP